MKIVEKSVDALKPYAKNPRKLTPEQIDGIAESIKQFGYDVPILVDKAFRVIAGHGRLEALKKLGVKKVKVVVQDKLTAQQARARRLLDNRQTESREYDRDLLRTELADLDIDFGQFACSFDDLMFEPDPEDEEKPDDDPPPKKTDRIELTADQMETVRRAIDKVKDQTGDEGMSDGRAVELLAAEYLAGV